MVEEATKVLSDSPPAEDREEGGQAAEEQGRRYSLYREMGGRVPQETFKGMLTLLEDLKPGSFNEAQQKAYNHRRSLARGNAQWAKIAITPQIENLFSILRENLKKKDLFVYPGEREPFWSDHRVMAEALLMAGDFPKYKTFIHSLPETFVKEIEMERSPLPISQAA